MLVTKEVRAYLPPKRLIEAFNEHVCMCVRVCVYVCVYVCFVHSAAVSCLYLQQKSVIKHSRLSVLCGFSRLF